MTNEEAIEMLKSKMDGQTDTSYEWAETVRMAIKALEQEPCEDAISRKALIERINHAEENFKADNMESIASDDADPFIDGVLSGIFNIRQMVIQAQSVTPTHIEQEPVLDNATNGDMIQAMFPNIKIEYIKKLSGMNYYEVSGMNDFEATINFYEDWWNALYKAERHTCGECQEWGTVNCSETYREPTKNDDICESFKAESEERIE